MISLGIEQLVTNPLRELNGKKLALLCNQASTDRLFQHSRDLINNTFPGQLTCLFSPQHGFFSEKQDNMVESGHIRDLVSGLPVFSLYADKRKPDPEMFESFDVLLIDLIDVGTRVYTFIWTVIYCLQTAAETGKKIIILDRPNPIGGHLVEGNLLKPSWKSFVGLMEIPMRHGMTIGELALMCNSEMSINAEVEVVKVDGWKRRMFFEDLGIPWVFPSPNMPSPTTAHVYPGQVIWEGTNMSEGRGTTLPFELCGAPYFKPLEVLHHLQSTDLPGCILRSIFFEPTSGKWAGENCGGIHIHITDSQAFRPYRTSMSLLQAVLVLYPDDFTYKEPPYEYEYTRMPIDLIIGDQDVRMALESGVEIYELEKNWQGELDRFNELRMGYLLYDER